MEDYIFGILEKHFIVEHHGGDKERSIKPAMAITNQSDLLIYNNNKQPVSLEITNDYTGLFTNKKICNFRDFKFQRLKSNSLNQQTLILGIDIINNNFFVIDLSEFNSIRKIHSHPPFGGKPAVELDLKEITFLNFSPNILIKTLKLLIN